jgi:hypothetical protein
MANRTETIKFRVTPGEREAISWCADLSGMTAAAWIRRLVAAELGRLRYTDDSHCFGAQHGDDRQR